MKKCEILIIVTKIAYSVNLAYQVSTSQFVKDGWQILNPVSGGPSYQSNCGTTTLFGGYQKFDQNTKITYFMKLPPHSQIEIGYDFWKIDGPLDFLYSSVDSCLAVDFMQEGNGSGSNLCGSSTNDIKFTIKSQFNHSSSTVFIEITPILKRNIFWGISYLNISYIESDTQHQFMSCGDFILSKGEECEDGNMIPFDGCHNCQYSCVQGCSLCVLGVCYDCQEEWEYIEQLYFCLLTQDENASTSQKLSQVFSFINCGLNCIVCIDEVCIQCQNGFQLNIISGICQSVCEDRIISNDEEYENRITKECEDGNMIPFDGCHNCQYSCVQGCSLCVLGVCYDCQEEWEYIEQLHFCLLAQDENASTSQKLQQVFSFINCGLNCIVCIDEVCIQCQNGFQFNIVSGLCQSVCEDRIISNDEEYENRITKECEDGNMIPFDGCHNCQYSCVEGCSLCFLGVCYDCQKEWEYIEQLHFCSLAYDANASTSKKCNNKCVFCYEGQCQRCNNGYTLQDNECISICGDLLVNRDIDNGKQIEECDNPSSLGCLDCKIQPSYQCIGQDYQICLTCDELCLECVKINNNLYCQQCIKGYYPKNEICLECDFNCITCHQTSEECTSCYKDDCTYCEDTPGLYRDVRQGKCISVCGDGIYVKYLEQCDDGNNDDEDGCSSACEIEYFDEQQYTNNTQQFTKRMRNNITSTQIETSQKLLALQNKLNYTLWAIGVLLFLTGNRQPLWDALEILQQESYLRFINVEFPQNIVIYFQSSEWISLSPILNYFHFNELPEQIGLEYIQTDDKLKQYQENANLAYNIQSLIINIVAFCFLSLLLIRIQKKLHSVEYLKFNYFLTRQLQKLSIKVNKMVAQMKKNGLIQLLHANFWDFFFMIFLQLKFCKGDDLQNQLLNYLALSMMAFSITLILQNLFEMKSKRQAFKNYWNEKIEAFIIIKKLWYIAVIVLFQKSQILQTTILIIIDSLHLIVIIKFKIFSNKLECIKIIAQETVMLIVQITIYLYCYDALIQLDQDHIVVLAWLDIGLLISIFVFHFILDSFEAIKTIGSAIYEQCKKKQQNSIAQNPF